MNRAQKRMVGRDGIEPPTPGFSARDLAAAEGERFSSVLIARGRDAVLVRVTGTMSRVGPRTGPGGGPMPGPETGLGWRRGMLSGWTRLVCGRARAGGGRSRQAATSE